MAEMNHAERAHALLSASGSDRWTNCPASARLEENEPEQTSDFAEEGTLAHEFAEIMLRVDLKLMPMAEYRKKVAELRKHRLFYADIEEDVKPYVDYVKQQFKEAKTKDPFAKILIEQKFNLKRYVEDGFGTSDAMIFASGKLEVIDLKFGKGKLVEAKENPQLKYYGLGGMEFLDTPDSIYVTLTIVQPRLENISSWGLPGFFLRKWGREVLAPKAVEAYAGDGEQKAGDWCQYCKIKAKCRALYDMSMELAKQDFEKILDPRLLTDAELLEAYSKSDFITKWLSAVKDLIYKEALNGKAWQGYKLVEGRSNRVWKDENKVVEVLETNLYDPLEFLNSKLKGLGDLEKLLGKKSFNDLLESLTTKPPGAPTLVSEDDKRPIFGTGQAQKDFAQEIDELLT